MSESNNINLCPDCNAPLCQGWSKCGMCGRKKEISMENAINEWIQNVANIVVMGEPFYNENKFFMSFQANNHIYSVTLTKEPNNIIPFPEKKKLPKRI